MSIISTKQKLQQLLTLKLLRASTRRILRIKAQVALNRRIYEELQVMFGDDPKYAERYCKAIMDGHDEVARNLTRLTKKQYIDLDRWLCDHGGLQSSPKTPTLLKVMIFCYICGKDASVCDAALHWRRSISRISLAMQDVLSAMQHLHQHYVRLPEGLTTIPSRIANDPKLLYLWIALVL